MFAMFMVHGAAEIYCTSFICVSLCVPRGENGGKRAEWVLRKYANICFGLNISVRIAILNGVLIFCNILL